MSTTSKVILLLAVSVLVVGSGFATESYGSWKAFGILVGAWLTLAIFSFLYADNPIYKFAEHLFVGVAAGYGVAVTFWQMIVPNLLYRVLAPPPSMTGPALAHWAPDFWLIVPLIFGLFFFTRFTAKHAYMVRWSLAFLIGGFAGVKLTGHAQGDLVAQAGATMLPIVGPEFLPPWPFLRPGDYGLNHILIVVGVITTLSYFFFSKPHKGVLGKSARLGIWFLMIAFGASFGYTVMARISLLIGRLLFLLKDWLGPVLQIG